MNSTSELLGLYLSNPEDPSEKILHAISFDKDILKNMLDLIDKEYFKRSKIEFLPVKFYSVLRILDTKNFQKFPKTLYGKNNDLMFIELTHFNKESMENKIFGFTRVFNNHIEESIISIGHDSHYDSLEYKNHLKYIRNTYVFKNLSENPIKFDTFYDEGVINS